MFSDKDRNQQGYVEAWGFFMQTLEGVVNGLIFLHDMGFVHRDIKLSNILVRAVCVCVCVCVCVGVGVCVCVCVLKSITKTVDLEIILTLPIKISPFTHVAFSFGAEAFPSIVF